MTSIRRPLCSSVLPVLVTSAVGLAGVAACSSPTAPAPTPTATPVPTPIPTPVPDPNVPPAGSGCGQPYPPPISRFQVKIHMKLADFWALDSTPLVGPDAAYCRDIGFTDGRGFCPVRPEGSPEREACEKWRVGLAKDTGTPGPTWSLTTKDGVTTYCTGEAAGCAHFEDNPFPIKAYKGGLYEVCTADGLCGEVDVDRNL